MAGFHSSDHSFTLQAIMELQKSVGEMNANLMAMKGSLDTTRSKVDGLVEANATHVSMKGSIDSIKSKVDDLVGWKHMILGGAAVLGVVIAALSFAIGKASEYFTFKNPATTQSVQVAPPTVDQTQITQKPLSKGK